MASYGCKITVVPSTWPASETLKMKPDGVLFSNGPGDPSAVPYAVESVKKIIGQVPVFGICMGHQLLGQALGGKTYKMKFGHHGGNHPVRNIRTGRVEISAQVLKKTDFLLFQFLICKYFLAAYVSKFIRFQFFILYLLKSILFCCFLCTKLGPAFNSHGILMIKNILHGGKYFSVP